MTVRPQYITNANGERTSVILSIEEYERLLEEVEDAEDVKLYDKAKAAKQEFVDAKDAFVDVLESNV